MKKFQAASTKPQKNRKPFGIWNLEFRIWQRGFTPPLENGVTQRVSYLGRIMSRCWTKQRYLLSLPGLRKDETPFFSAGFTLLETIVALTVIVSAIAGPVTLATRGIFNSKFAKNKLVAANLAQEGLEMVRKLRDDNVLAAQAWDLGIGIGDWQMDVLGSALTPFTGTVLLRDSASGLYNYSSGQNTLFTRRITITKPVADQTLVVSRVTWQDAEISRIMTLQETFYNWR